MLDYYKNLLHKLLVHQEQLQLKSKHKICHCKRCISIDTDSLLSHETNIALILLILKQYKIIHMLIQYNSTLKNH